MMSSTQVRGRKRALWVAAGSTFLAIVALVVEMCRSDTALIDLRVYRVGGQAWLEGFSLYAPDFPAPLDGPALPFTYPPLAAVLFSVMNAIPWIVLALLWTVMCIACLVWVCVLVARRVHSGPETYLIGIGAAGAALLLEPVRATLDFGQINLLLLALITTDCLLRRPRWPRGVLLGLAAATKLTPLIFLVYFLVRGDRRGAATMAASFAGFGLLGYLLARADSLRYWFDVLADPSRVGGLAFASNQSLRGFLHRLGLSDSLELALWATSATAVVILTAVAARKAVVRGQDALAMLVVGTAALLVSPVSWSHHWVWIAPTLVIGFGAVKGRARVITAAVVAVVFLIGPHALLPAGGDRELEWSLVQHIVGNAYLWCGLFPLCWITFSATASPTGRRNPTANLRHRVDASSAADTRGPVFSSPAP